MPSPYLPSPYLQPEPKPENKVVIDLTDTQASPLNTATSRTPHKVPSLDRGPKIEQTEQPCRKAPDSMPLFDHDESSDYAKALKFQKTVERFPTPPLRVPKKETILLQNDVQDVAVDKLPVPVIQGYCNVPFLYNRHKSSHERSSNHLPLDLEEGDQVDRQITFGALAFIWKNHI